MTILYVELGVLIVALVGVMVVFWVAHVRLLDRVYDRQKALDHYAKSAARDAQAVMREAQGTLEAVARVRDDTRLIQQRVEQHLSDPRVRRLLDG